MRMLSSLALAVAMTVPVLAQAADAPQPGTGKSVVIVPGSFVDGSGWRVVHDILIHKGRSPGAPPTPAGSAARRIPNGTACRSTA